MLKTPVIYAVFNRPSQTRTTFARIAQAKPIRLLVIADGPRRNRPGEPERCEEVRRIVTAVDWPCELEINFANENMGCRDRIVSGLNWAFERVEEAIILEDDILPDMSFFPFCEQMLERYRGDDRIAMISGFNQVQNYVKSDSSYFFSQLTHIWGWATWRKAWARYDQHLKDWPRIRRSGLLQEIFDQPRVAAYWLQIFNGMHDGTGPNTWDYQWAYTNLINNGLSIVPKVNLIENIGFGVAATHTAGPPKKHLPDVHSLEFPLAHPPSLIPSRSLDRCDLEIEGCRLPTLPGRIQRKVMRVGAKILSGRPA